MRIYEPPPATTVDTINRFGEFATRGGSPEAAAQAWTAAEFSDEMTARWLKAGCFDPVAARALTNLGVTAGQASSRTRDGGDRAIGTIASKVANGDLTPRQGAARCMSSR